MKITSIWLAVVALLSFGVWKSLTTSPDANHSFSLENGVADRVRKADPSADISLGSTVAFTSAQELKNYIKEHNFRFTNSRFSQDSGEWMKIVHQWMERDVALALEMIALFPEERQRYYALTWSQVWFASHPREFLAFAEEHLSPDSYKSSWYRVMEETGKSAPQLALEIILEAGQGRRKDAMIRSAFGAWAAVAPKDALKGMLELPFPEDKDSAVASIASSANPSFLSLLYERNFMTLPEHQRMLIGKSVLESAAREGGVEGIKKLYLENPDLKIYGSGAVFALGHENWREFPSAMDSLIDQGILDLERDAGVIAEGLAKNHEPKAAIDFAVSVPEELRAAAVYAVMNQLAKYDMKETLIPMLYQVPQGDGRSAAAQPLIDVLQHGGEKEQVLLRKIETVIGGQ